MTRHEKIVHKGQTIWHFNYSGLRGEELLAYLQANTRTLLDSPEHDFLTLSDFSNTYGDDQTVAFLQSEEAKAAAKKTKKKAVLGITGIKKMFLNIYNAATGGKTRAFDDIQAAKDFLVS